jgi:hypothetical protein
MIGHQAVGVQTALGQPKMTAKVEKIKAAILLLEKAVLPVISPLTDMYRNTGQHDPSAARHAC